MRTLTFNGFSVDELLKALEALTYWCHRDERLFYVTLYDLIATIKKMRIFEAYRYHFLKYKARKLKMFGFYEAPIISKERTDTNEYKKKNGRKIKYKNFGRTARKIKRIC